MVGGEVGGGAGSGGGGEVGGEVGKMVRLKQPASCPPRKGNGKDMDWVYLAPILL